MPVVPERPAAEQQEQREDRELGNGDPLVTAIAVVPGEHEDYGQADQQCEGGELLDLFRRVEGVRDVGEALAESPGPAT